MPGSRSRAVSAARWSRESSPPPAQEGSWGIGPIGSAASGSGPPLHLVARLGSRVVAHDLRVSEEPAHVVEVSVGHAPERESIGGLRDHPTTLPTALNRLLVFDMCVKPPRGLPRSPHEDAEGVAGRVREHVQGLVLVVGAVQDEAPAQAQGVVVGRVEGIAVRHGEIQVQLHRHLG